MLAGRRRPVWLVAALTVLTLGLYLPIWFGLTAAEMRRETDDRRLSPLGNALGALVPGLNAWIAWRHFGAIDRLLERGSRGHVDGTSAAIGIVIWWLTFTHYSSDPLFVALDAIELGAGTAVVSYGQRALNRYWATQGAEERLVETDVIALAAAATYALFTIFAFLSAGT